MKLRIILAVSVCANLALLAFYLKKEAPPAAPVTATVAGPGTMQSPARPMEARTVRTESIVTNSFQWSSVESQDYRDYIANLRSIGCPEETVRDIIIADVNKLYGSRMAALHPSAKEFRFWAVEDNSQRLAEREREQKRRTLEREKRSLIKELLGVDLESELARWSGRPDEDEWRYGFLSPDKQAQFKALQDKYRELERAAFAEGGGNNAEGRAKLVALRAQREAELAQMLGPDDFLQYQLRTSSTARNMRENLAAFQPNEEEFRKIFELRKAFDDQFTGSRDGGDAGTREQRRLAQQQLEEQIRSTLGDQRYATYQLSQDDRYRELHEFGQRNNLAPETVQSVYDVRRTAEEMRRTLERDTTLTSEQRVAALTALANETRTALNSAMGEETFRSYQSRGGSWVNRLANVEQRGGRGGGGNGGEGDDRGRFQRGR